MRRTSGLAHLRTLLRLQVLGGRGFLATDFSCDRIVPLGPISDGEDLRPLMSDLLQKGDVFQAAHPDTLRAIIEDDPKLRRESVISGPLDVWPWQNGQSGLYLVYALEISRRL